MADIKLTTADASGFIPQLWAQRALDVLRNQIVLTQFVTRDSDWNAPASKGKSITVPYPGTFTAVNKAADTPLTPQVPSGGSSITLTLNNHKAVPFLVEDFAAAQANGSLMDRYIEPATVALAEQLENDLMAEIIVNAAGGTVGTPGTNMTSATLRTARQQFNVLKAPLSNRLIMVSPKDEASLLGDTTIQNYFAFSKPETVQNGVLGEVYGMAIAMGQLIPTATQVTVGAANAGTFTLTYGGQTTSAIAYNATPATVQAALVALSSVGAGNVVVTGAAPTWQVLFTGTLYGTTLPLTGAGTGLTGGAFAAPAVTTDNLAIHKNALMLAIRPFEPIPANAGVQVSQVRDPMTGLAIRLAAQWDINNVGMRVNLDMLYGVKTLRSNQAFVIQA